MNCPDFKFCLQTDIPEPHFLSEQYKEQISNFSPSPFSSLFLLRSLILYSPLFLSSPLKNVPLLVRYNHFPLVYIPDISFCN